MAVRSHLERGEFTDGMVFDAVRIRLLEIGEAVEALPSDLLATESSIPWNQIARMRDHLAHRYFDTSHAILQATVEHNLPELELADRRPPTHRAPRGTGPRRVGLSHKPNLRLKTLTAARLRITFAGTTRSTDFRRETNPAPA